MGVMLAEITKGQTQELADAMWQILDDMGASGHSCCPYAKAKARIAYEPFRLAETEELGEEIPCDMPISVARQIVDDCDAGR